MRQSDDMRMRTFDDLISGLGGLNGAFDYGMCLRVYVAVRTYTIILLILHCQTYRRVGLVWDFHTPSP